MTKSRPKKTKETPPHEQTKTNGAPKSIMGYAGIAEALSSHFQIPVSKMDISYWCHGKHLNHETPNFPPPNASGRFNRLECVDWYKKYKFQDPRENTTPELFAELSKKRAKGELETLEHEHFLRKVERGHYMEKAEHNRILSGLGAIGRDNLWELFDRIAYEEMQLRIAQAGLPEDWAQVVLNIMRKLNPELLLKHHAHLAGAIERAEEGVPEK